MYKCDIGILRDRGLRYDWEEYNTDLLYVAAMSAIRDLKFSSAVVAVLSQKDFDRGSLRRRLDARDLNDNNKKIVLGVLRESNIILW